MNLENTDNIKLKQAIARAAAKQPYKPNRLDDILNPGRPARYSSALPIPTEDDECMLLAPYLELLQNQGKIVLYTHIPNETYTTSMKQKTRNKKMGVTRGFPDYIILTKSKGIAIEMKRSKGGHLSVEQAQWIEGLKAVGMIGAVCWGFDEAREFIENNI